MDIPPSISSIWHHLGGLYKRLSHWYHQNGHFVGILAAFVSCADHTSPYCWVLAANRSRSRYLVHIYHSRGCQRIYLISRSNDCLHHTDSILPWHDGADGGFQDQITALSSTFEPQFHLHAHQYAVPSSHRLDHNKVFHSDRWIGKSRYFASILGAQSFDKLQLLHWVLYPADVSISWILALRHPSHVGESHCKIRAWCQASSQRK